MKRLSRLPAALLAVAAIALPVTEAAAQSLSLTRGRDPAKPYTVIFAPEFAATAGEGDTALVLTHNSVPLQCSLIVVPVEDSGWTAEGALATFDRAAIESGWQQGFPGFSVSEQRVVSFQNATALQYAGDSFGSPGGEAVHIVHAETVDDGRGYVVECLTPVRAKEAARPLVDFIIRNFSTRADAQCCVPDPA